MSSRAISASGDMVRPRLKERLCADSKRTFCHSRVLAACSAGIGPTWTDRSIGRARRHQPLQESGGQGAGPAAQVQGADQAVSDAHVSAAYLHLDRRLLVVLGGRASQSGGHQEHAKLAPSQVVDGQPGPCQQAAQVVDAGRLAHGVEAPVEDAVAGLKVGQQTPKGLSGGPRLRGQVGGLGLLEVLPQPSQAGRVLPDEQLRREVQGVERPGEGP